MITNKKTKIVATLGPASSSAEVIEGMILAGADVCRINFSHGSYDAVVEQLPGSDQLRQLHTAGHFRGNTGHR